MVVSVTSSPSWFPSSANGVRYCFLAVRIRWRLSASVSFGGRPERHVFSVFPCLWNFLMMSCAVLSERSRRVAALETLSPASTAPTSQYFVAGECWRREVFGCVITTCKYEDVERS